MNKLMEKLIKNSPTKHTSILSESVMFKDKDVIPTEIPIVNLAFSGELDGGISSGLTLLAGPSKVFKTNLALVCVKAFMDKYDDGICILYDSEGGSTPEYLASLGVDSSRVIHVPIEHIEMLKFDIVKQLKEIDRTDKVIIVIDSIGNTASLKELEDAFNEKSVVEMQRAKSIKGLFRMITPSLVSKDVPCIAICHTYQEMSSMYPRQVISGGLGLIYSANQAFIIGKSQEKDGTEVSGFNFTLNVEKSRFVREKSKFTFSVNFDKGINKWSGLLDLALESGDCVKPSMGWYQLVDTETGEFLGNKVRAKDTECNEFLGVIMKRPAFKDFVSNKFKLAHGAKSELTNEDIEDEFNKEIEENYDE